MNCVLLHTAHIRAHCYKELWLLPCQVRKPPQWGCPPALLSWAIPLCPPRWSQPPSPPATQPPTHLIPGLLTCECNQLLYHGQWHSSTCRCHWSTISHCWGSLEGNGATGIGRNNLQWTWKSMLPFFSKVWFFFISTCIKQKFQFLLFCVYMYKVKLTTIVEGNSKAPFSLATTPRCRGGHYSFPWIAPLYPWSLS